MKKIILITIFLISVLALQSQTLEYHVQRPQKLFVGTPFHLLVDIKTSLQDSIFAPEIDTLDIFILKGIKSKDKIEKDNVTTSIDFIFQPFDTGEFTFPELEFAVKSADNISYLKTKEFILNIESVISDSTQTIADIAAPLAVGLGFWDYFIPLLIIALSIAGVIFLVRYLKNRKGNILAPIIVDNRPPYLIVLELLEKLKQEKLLEKGHFLQYHFRLSLLLRLFIELQFKVNAVEMTTSEIRNYLSLDDFHEKSQIMDFLTFADKVKFAKFIPTTAESESALNWLEQYLQSYKAKADVNQKVNESLSTTESEEQTNA
ncbi:MAG: hypothetical protein Q7J16_04910 [Candidatus Cloacimonadales bacterium]|nr:hypothetical protein [Candidatus Cloacimonadales bacterium]